jgi:molybdate transport system permease protein
VAFAFRLGGSGDHGFGAPVLGAALRTSVLAATISTAIIAVLGVPFAYVLARSRSRVVALGGLLATLRLAIPPLMSGILLIYVVGPYSRLGGFANGRLTDSLAGIVLAQTFVAAPFLLVVARAAFASIDPALFDLAAGLGRRETYRFWHVALPAAREGVRAGLLLAWLRAFGEYGATVILAYHPYSLPVYTYVQFSGSSLSTTEAPTALALLLASVLFVAARLHGRPRRRRVGAIPAPRAPKPAGGEPVAFDLDLRLDEFRLTVDHRSSSRRLAILGPSGSGKTATLRCVAGLYGPSVGQVFYGGSDMTSVPTEERRVGYLPQDPALFPHLTVWGQVLFGAGADPCLAAYWLDRLRLDGLHDRLPRELSGGQRRRVTLAQTLARAPRLVLLDEPFSALDVPVRDELSHDFRRLQLETGLSTVLVTYDPQEAALLADEILIVVDGRIVQAGSRREVFSTPACPAAARVLGVTNVFPGVVRAHGFIEAAGVTLVAPTGELDAGTGVDWCIRAEHVEVGARGRHGAAVVDEIDLGAATELMLELAAGLVVRARRSNLEPLVAHAVARATLPREAITSGSEQERGAMPRRTTRSRVSVSWFRPGSVRDPA